MCNNIIVLYIFMFIKFVSLIILPMIIVIKRKKDYVKVLIIIDIVLLIFFLICNIFTLNKCVYNSTLSGVQRTKNENMLTTYNNLHPESINNHNLIEADTNHKTYKGNNFYYYNINDEYMKNIYYECEGNKVYFNMFGSAITSFASAVSTLYNNSITPLEIYNVYKKDNDMCNNKITIDGIYNSFIKKYANIEVSQITSDKIYKSLVQGNLVIAELSAKENSKLTCFNNFIVIYSVDLTDNYMISDPALLSTSFVCPYTSRAYGNIIDSENMNRSWTIDDIKNESVRFYLVKKV